MKKKEYVQFSKCFAAYSGNSMVEKWLVRRFDMHSREEEKEDEG